MKIIEDAFEAAKNAEAKFRELHGEPAYCGFAWVTVKPGNCAVAKILKKEYGCRAGYQGGVQVWNPGRSNTQSMDIKEEGARAFAAVLRNGGIQAISESRAD